MGPFITSTLMAALATASLVHAAPKTDHKATGKNLVRDHALLKSFTDTITSANFDVFANWTAAGDDVCDWAGITCAMHPKGYKAVGLIHFNEFGLGEDLKLDGWLEKMVDVSIFHVNSNDFTGSIPNLSKLKYLFEFDVSNNRLSGPFPTHLLDSPLTTLDLRFNQFSGPLPDTLFTKTDMDIIFLNNNNFTGHIPPTGNIRTMYIVLANNQLTGEIPASLANNKALKEMNLSGNQLRGNIPEALCALKLDILDVSNNAGLTGKLGPKCRALLKRDALVINGTSLTY